MGYQSGKTYWIVPYDNQNYALSVYGNSQVSQNRNVVVWSKEDIADQLWQIDVNTTGGFARIKSKLNTAYALNIWFGSDNYGNCDIHTWSDNLEDSKVNFITYDADNNVYAIQCYTDGGKYDLYLTATGISDGANVKWAAHDESKKQLWKLIEKKSDNSKNYLIYPTEVMRITQTYNGDYSHSPNFTGSPADYPIDEGCVDSNRSYFYCPCDEMEIKRIYTTGTNTIWLESTTPVEMPFGSAYVTMLVMHVNTEDLSKLYVGQKFIRKQAMFPEGNDGAKAYHFHISVGTGKISGLGWVKNSQGGWVLTTTGMCLKPEHAFYVDPTFTTVVNSMGLSFTNLP